MNDDVKRLMEFLGECPHEFESFTYKNVTCLKCHKMIHDPLDANRPFDTPDDFFALVKRLRETGQWNEFIRYSLIKFSPDYPPMYGEFTNWLLDPARFAGLVAEFVEEEKGMNAIKLAIRFHELYEKYAPEYGYETRAESRVFDASSPNGRLMIRVCRDIQKDLDINMKDPHP
jgi:hypothetical protein